MFIRGNADISGLETAILSSPIFSENSVDVCFEFWYYMLGNKVETLTIYQYFSDSIRILWKLSGNQQNQWMRANFPFESKRFYYFSIEADAAHNDEKYFLYLITLKSVFSSFIHAKFKLDSNRRY